MLRGIVLGIMLLVAFGLFSHTAFWLFRYVTMGRKQDLPVSLGERVQSFLTYVLGQRRVIMEPAGVLHFFIFWGFLVLQLETIEYFIRGFYWKFHFSMFVGEPLYNAMLFAQDAIALAILVAISIAAFRRFLLRPQHAVVSMDAAVILLLIGGLMVTKFVANGAEIAMMPAAELGHNPFFTPTAHAISFLMGGPGKAIGSGLAWGVYHTGYWLHIGIVLFFLNYIPFGKHLHLLGAMPNVFFRKLEPRGALYKLDIEAITEQAEKDGVDPKYGASEVEELTWKQLLDTYACTECGRCQKYCPAYNSGKPLNPMMIIHNIKEHLREKGEVALQEGKGLMSMIGGESPISTYAFEGGDMPSLVGGVVTAEELWACTTCGACVGNCPVFIEHVDTIVDMRRYLALTEGSLSPEVARTFRNIESNANPWGISASYRADWTEGLDIPLMRDVKEMPEYLFFVGCAGSFDDRQKKVTQSLAKVLKAADVSFAILGGEEKCTGDPARRIGEEYLFQQMAEANIEVLNKYGVTKVITACPHCFHTIGKEYPPFGGNYEVLHHSEVLAELVRTGRIALNGEMSGRIVYHDSCYLGRWNDIYDPPRDIVDAIPGSQRVEMELNRRQSFCCGAGGGRMWMEEDLGQRINIARADQAIETEPDIVTVGCPFCMTMIDDGLKHRGADDVKIVDVAELIAANMQN